MPAALARACAGRGGMCPNLTTETRCTACLRATETRRGSAHARGYTRHWRETFIPHFTGLLIAADIVPACGASLPCGPDLTGISRCVAEGRLTTQHLHLHHDPPLTDAERKDRQAVEDPLRVGFVCVFCHNTETSKHQESSAA